jgi:hypothetical protein
VLAQEGVNAVLQHDRATRELYDFPMGGPPARVSQQTRAARASCAAATALAQPSSTSCYRSKSALCRHSSRSANGVSV